MPADPRQLMMSYCDGDAQAFRDLYQLVAPRLVGYLIRMTRDRASADDLVQQTFLKVHRARGAYVRGADPVPWIYAIAHRTFIDDVRKKKRGAGLTDAGEIPEVPAVITGESATASAEQPAVDPELRRRALRELDRLPVQQREAVVLTKLDGRSIAEAAEIAGTTPGAMKVRAHRGYMALRRALGGSP